MNEPTGTIFNIQTFQSGIRVGKFYRTSRITLGFTGTLFMEMAYG